MRFHPTEEQLAIQDALKGTLENSMPRQRLDEIIDGDRDFDDESWNALMALGLGGLLLPENAGGSGLGLLDLAMAIEALGQGAVVGPITQHCLGGLALKLTKNDPAREEWLGKVAAGEAVATLALGGNWLPESWDSVVADGKISGRVAFAPGARSAQLIVVGTQGGGLALVETGPDVTIEPLASADRTRRLSAITFNEARATVLFEAGDQQVSRIFDAALVLAAADALGGAQFCLDLSVDYAKERQQFGVPIGRFQALKHQLAQMALEVEPARALLWYAAYAWDSEQEDASRAAAMAKAHIADRFVSVARAAIAAHGGIGYTWEYGLNTWFRRSLFDRVYLGSPTLHRARSAEMAGW